MPAATGVATVAAAEWAGRAAACGKSSYGSGATTSETRRTNGAGRDVEGTPSAPSASRERANRDNGNNSRNCSSNSNACGGEEISGECSSGDVPMLTEKRTAIC